MLEDVAEEDSFRDVGWDAESLRKEYGQSDVLPSNPTEDRAEDDQA